MKLSAKDYAQALYQLSDKGRELNQSLVGQFLAKLKSNRDLALLPLIYDQLEKLWVAESGKTVVDLTLAKPISDLDRLADSTMILRFKIDPSIIGGAIVRVGDKTIDHSFKTKLASLKEQ